MTILEMNLNLKLDPSSLFNKTMGCFMFLLILPFSLIAQNVPALRYYVDDLLLEARLIKTYDRMEAANKEA